VSKSVNIWQTIQDRVIDHDAQPDQFNPYRNRHPRWDINNAPRIRIENLKNYVDDHSSGVRILLVTEAPGPWGCRFSGVPITSEAQVVDTDFPARGLRTTRRDKPFSEYSASIYWRVLARYYDQIFTWNAVPVHPFHPGRPDSIRPPRQAEINHFLPVLGDVTEWAKPDRILAVGRKAEQALTRLGLQAEYVRHPSQGGSKIFEAGIRRVLDDLDLRPTNSIPESELRVHE
jgi:hypothetical protein